MNRQLRDEIDGLLYAMLETTATPEDVERLNSLMASHSEVRRYVADYYYLTAALRKSNAVVLAFGTENEFVEHPHLLDEMARIEQTAPSLEKAIVCERPREPERDTTPPRTPYRINPFSYALIISSLAAFLAIFVYVNFMPERMSVAVLNDTIDARWQGIEGEIQNGYFFYDTDEPRVLKKGIIAIKFDYGATVVIEGPSEFACRSGNRIEMSYGRLYARVPGRASGFVVETENSRIVDLGTEFAVQANVDGSTALHVFKGLTKLTPASEKAGNSVDIGAGQAREVHSDGETIRAIHLKENAFVRQINSGTNLIRRGQKGVDLADIVGGGNGFGTGRQNRGVNPETGELTPITGYDRKSDNAYRPVRLNPFIDGVFVPNGPEQIVDSQGHTFRECPPTEAYYYMEIANAPRRVDRTEVFLGDMNCSRGEEPSMFLHANLGITFDLEAIRSQLAGVEISRFQSRIGISDTAWRDCKADFWVLVDGEVRYKKESVTRKGVLDFVDIELSSTDRFLTLIATDGGGGVGRLVDDHMRVIDSDWCIFGEPVLVLE